LADPVILYDVDDKIGIVTLNRPDKLNAISAELQHQLEDAFADADADPATSVVLLRAAGRSFCAGYDIGAKEPGHDDWRSDPLKAHEHLKVQLDFEMTPWAMKKPVIASVQGHVMGGGCELVMLCDLTIAADNAVFGESEVRFSSVGPAIVMPAIIGYKKDRRPGRIVARHGQPRGLCRQTRRQPHRRRRRLSHRTLCRARRRRPALCDEDRARRQVPRPRRRRGRPRRGPLARRPIQGIIAPEKKSRLPTALRDARLAGSSG
jgi:Enoyl-CoA hydratase/isomerase